MTAIGQASAYVSCCHKALTNLADVWFDKANLSFIKHVVGFFSIPKEQISVKMGFRTDHLPGDKALDTCQQNLSHTWKTRSNQTVKILLYHSNSIPNTKRYTYKTTTNNKKNKEEERRFRLLNPLGGQYFYFPSILLNF